MEFSAQQIADFLQGEIEGNPDVKVSDLSKIEDGKPGTITFLSNPKYTHYIYQTKADIVLINKTLKLEKNIQPTLIRVENAYQALTSLLTLTDQYKPKRKGISSITAVAPTADITNVAYIGDFVSIGEHSRIGKQSYIYPQVAIGNNVQIGDNVILYPGVKIYDDCVIGNNCILHAGVVIGSDGFGFAPTDDGSYKKIPQSGNVILEDNVEIGANTVIDCATMGSTIIHKGVKLDNLIQVAHNVEIGENTVMASQTGVAGSSKIGRNCIFAGQVGIAGHIIIADKTILGAQTGVPNSIKEEGTTQMGYPAIAAGNFRRSSVVYKNLPELQRTISQLEKRIEALEKNIQ